MAESTANALQIDAAVDGAFTALNTTHSCFKSRQREAIVSMLGGHDTFVRLPTGYGKTIIIAVLPTAFDHLRQQEGSIVLCICPLIALMIDQTRRLKEISLSSVFLGSAQTDRAAVDRVKAGKAQCVVASPESILSETNREMLLTTTYTENLRAVVINEAHCITKWCVTQTILHACTYILIYC